MGKGKGAPDHWVAVVRPGRVLFEMAGIPKDTAKHALALAASKMPMGTRIVVRQGVKTTM